MYADLFQSVEVGNNFSNTKYVVLQMLQGMQNKNEKDEYVTLTQGVKDMKTLW